MTRRKGGWLGNSVGWKGCPRRLYKKRPITKCRVTVMSTRLQGSKWGRPDPSEAGQPRPLHSTGFPKAPAESWRALTTGLAPPLISSIMSEEWDEDSGRDIQPLLFSDV